MQICATIQEREEKEFQDRGRGGGGIGRKSGLVDGCGCGEKMQHGSSEKEL